MAEREELPPIEATLLAALCDCDVAAVERAREVLRLPRFSTRYTARLKTLQRIAYHLGTVIEIRPRGGYSSLAGKRGILKIITIEQGQRFADFWGIQPGGLVSTYWGESTQFQLTEHARDSGIELRFASFLEAVGSVHAETPDA
jgi:hypothetical protein